ncbi:AAA family ATPase [Paenibacillus lycopersici]|uniref:AAA family ATPase n=1 Tax=Paenibacillus lycopersici TaxID=2704462 RepID=A0A6C0G375_9BACL|nr:ATP-binding protein [Paenibacillus lycopersici]QHT61080.1 AAA family ATPase [Paenibacillus lycopersici]
MSKNSSSRLPRAKGIDMAAVYTPKECANKSKRIVMHARNRQIIGEFITILELREQFDRFDVQVPNKAVMFGPPGTGKTLTAFYLAERLGLPLIVARLDSIIHSHLGETASNLRRIFEFARPSGKPLLTGRVYRFITSWKLMTSMSRVKFNRNNYVNFNQAT